MHHETQQKTKQSTPTSVGITLVAGPTTLIILTRTLYAVVNFIIASVTRSPDALFGESEPVAAFINIILFILGTLGVVAWLPCLIIGIILLASKKK